MSLMQVGWIGTNQFDGREQEHLVDMTDAQTREVEQVLKERYKKGEVFSYWINDALPYDFKTFLKKVL